ncbi:FG-GAP repeat domain-containing protein [Zeaxanthinibacter enoshimensis]|uniref:VCBS repeat protein n=1 Tax=Zeaxanthinibacter enoshimensis TaxID=392009 RepID=A0A4R6TKP2_9FLAO|nr:VCBS repeat-containing protein [Zeaxanthinibacter enoshimensis]TDQ31406.1 VCBS repeat protein [Zeaxanthinibacter enoshimensis]
MLFLAFSCNPAKKKRQVALYQSYCGSCHLPPSIEDLPRDLWAGSVLPDMAARLGIAEAGYNPYEGLTYREQEEIMKTGIYPGQPLIAREDWDLLRAYILEMAPQELRGLENRNVDPEQLRFRVKVLQSDSLPGSYISALTYKQQNSSLWVGDLSGGLRHFNFKDSTWHDMGTYGRGITNYSGTDSLPLVTSVGKLDPSEIAQGNLFNVQSGERLAITEPLHRPVHSLVADLDQDGSEEILVSEFGNLGGSLSLFKRNGHNYEKKILIHQPGVIKTSVLDMNADGLPDIVAMTTQGDESITILYQQQNGEFLQEKVIRYSPLYGSSWFELMDYDGDGDMDIVSVHGDNADKTYVHKPYHGMRIHINDGQNRFEEAYFFPMHGATRVSADDFDLDGDMDFALISTFPDYEKESLETFIYLENQDSKSFTFKATGQAVSDMGRWFLMDTGDVDEDGDTDLILSSFTYAFTPIPEEQMKAWDMYGIDLLLLENLTVD